MTEAEWLACDDPVAMLRSLRGAVSERKLRLFACACCRALRVTLIPASLAEAVATAEGHADGQPPGGEGSKAWQFASALARQADDLWLEGGEGGAEAPHAHRFAARMAAVALSPPGEVARAIEAALPGQWPGALCCAARAREVIGNPFRAGCLEPSCLTDDALSLARAAYRERGALSGHLDPARLSVLADALEEAGCSDDALLAHLQSRGPHVRGCWAVDVALGKE
jgi:hypothetical protein